MNYVLSSAARVGFLFWLVEFRRWGVNHGGVLCMVDAESPESTTRSGQICISITDQSLDGLGLI